MSQDNQLKTIFENITKGIDEDVHDFTPVRSICDKYNIQPSHFILIVAGSILFFTAIGLFGHIIVTLIGLLYPAYMSYKVSMWLLRQSKRSLKISAKIG